MVAQNIQKRGVEMQQEYESRIVQVSNEHQDDANQRAAMYQHRIMSMEQQIIGFEIDVQELNDVKAELAKARDQYGRLVEKRNEVCDNSITTLARLHEINREKAEERERSMEMIARYDAELRAMQQHEHHASNLKVEVDQMRRYHELERRNHDEKYLSEIAKFKEAEKFVLEKMETRMSSVYDEWRMERNHYDSLSTRRKILVDKSSGKAVIADPENHESLNGLEIELADRERTLAESTGEIAVLRSQSAQLESKVESLRANVRLEYQARERDTLDNNVELREVKFQRNTLQRQVVDLKGNISELEQRIKEYKNGLRTRYGDQDPNLIVPEVATLRVQLDRKNRELTAITEQEENRLKHCEDEMKNAIHQEKMAFYDLLNMSNDVKLLKSERDSLRSEMRGPPGLSFPNI
jgi:chromosome segregation ATPase